MKVAYDDINHLRCGHKLRLTFLTLICINPRWPLPVVGIFIYYYCSSFYGMPLWCNFYAGSLNRIRICYNNGFRLLHSLDWRCSASHMFVSRNVRSFAEIQRRMAYSFLASLDSHSNSLIRLTSLATFAIQSRLQIFSRHLLYLYSWYIYNMYMDKVWNKIILYYY